MVLAPQRAIRRAAEVGQQADRRRADALLRRGMRRQDDGRQALAVHADPVPHAMFLVVDQVAAGRGVPVHARRAVVAQVQQPLQLMRLFAVLLGVAGLDPDLALLERQIEQRRVEQRSGAPRRRARSGHGDRRSLDRRVAHRPLDFDVSTGQCGCDVADVQRACRRAVPLVRERKHLVDGFSRGCLTGLSIEQLQQGRLATLARFRCPDRAARLRQGFRLGSDARLRRPARAGDEARQQTSRAPGTLFPGFGLRLARR